MTVDFTRRISFSHLAMTMAFLWLNMLVISVSHAGAVQKIALIIGNSAYETAPIPNSVRDADLIAATLRQLDFEVTIETNLNRKKMRRSIRKFGDRLTQETIGLFYYSGHGMQVRGINYMIPVNEDIQSDIDVEDSGVSVRSVLGRMYSARTSLNVIVLDACRNNPFEKSYKDGSQGLTRMDAPPGTLIAYATAPGKVADTGDRGSVSPYTKALSEELLISRKPILQLFNSVSYKLWDQYGVGQTPYIESTAIPEITFLANGLDKPIVAGTTPIKPQPTIAAKPPVTVITKPPPVIVTKPPPTPVIKPPLAATASLRIQQECKGGDATSCIDLGENYENGRGVVQDYNRAAKLYRLGCDAREALGCSNLGRMYDKGHGVDYDPEKAAAFYKLGCDGGEAMGCTNLGWMYEKGGGVKEDDIAAAALYKKGCDGGSALGCSNLAWMYEKGNGVEKDVTKAADLYRQGCDGGDEFSCKKLKKLSQ